MYIQWPSVNDTRFHQSLAGRLSESSILAATNQKLDNIGI
jgi:hypothetical protein